MLPTVNPDDRFLINDSQERYVGPGCCFVECPAGLFRHLSEARLGVAIGFQFELIGGRKFVSSDWWFVRNPEKLGRETNNTIGRLRLGWIGI